MFLSFTWYWDDSGVQFHGNCTSVDEAVVLRDHHVLQVDPGGVVEAVHVPHDVNEAIDRDEEWPDEVNSYGGECGVFEDESHHCDIITLL